MYTYISSVALRRQHGANWEQVDLGSEVVQSIYLEYIKVYLVLNQAVTNEEIYVDMDELVDDYVNHQGTLIEMLVDVANLTLPTVSELPTESIKYAIYENAVRVEYKVMLGKAGVHLPENYPVKGLTDLTLNRPKYSTDPRLVHSNTLVSVNGFYHNKDADRDFIYIYDGGKTAWQSKHTHVGILDFTNLGGVTEHKIKASDIYPVDEATHLKDKLIFSVDAPMEGKSVLLVLGGYLVSPYEGVFWRNGDNTFILDINRIPYLERLMYSRNYLDLSELGLKESLINPDEIDRDHAFSDEVIKNYLTLSQSFIVVVDIPYLTIETIALRSGGIPGMFTSYQEPKYPLRLDHGRMSEYWKVSESTRWSVTVHDSYFRDYIMEHSPKNLQDTVTGQIVPEKGFRHGPGELVKIGGFRL